MLGAIIGDVIGSTYEFCNPPIKHKDFVLFSADSFFTDDTVLTVAVADAILNQKDYGETLQSYARAYPNRGYGANFARWIETTPIKPYQSWGNGAAMRVSPVGFAYDDFESVLNEAENSALPSHDHPEGIKGAQATAVAIFEARHGMSKSAIVCDIEARFGYNLRRSLDEIRPQYAFDESCQGSVPESILCLVESTDFEDAIRLAVSLGGDADTLAAITGGMAQAFYRSIAPELVKETRQRLPASMLRVIDQFHERYGITHG